MFLKKSTFGSVLNAGKTRTAGLWTYKRCSMSEDPNLFLYRTDCRLCLTAAEDVAEFFGVRGIPLVIQKWSSNYATLVPGLPALIIRKNTFNTQQEIVVIGSKIVEQLKKLERTVE